MPKGDAPDTSGPLARLRAHLVADDLGQAFAVFLTLLSESAPDAALLDWTERGWSAFARSDDEPALSQTLDLARHDRIAALLLFGRAAFGNGHPASGVAAARVAFHHAPARSEPVFLLCAMQLARRDAEAQSLLNHCLASFPDPSDGWTALGTVLVELDKKPAALVCFARGVPSLALAIRCGRLAKDLGRLDEARAAFEGAVSLDPGSVRAWFLLGTCAQDARDFTAAAAAYRRALALDPGVPEAALNLGTVLQESGDLAGARTAYRQAVRLRSDTFGRVAQALSTSPKGELWLDLAALHRDLLGPGGDG